MYGLVNEAATERWCSKRGVYGFGLAGLPAADPLLVDAPGDWPELSVERTRDGTRPAAERLGEDRATLWLAGGGFAELDRRRLRARVRVPDGTADGAIVHPFLAPVALVMAWWLGRDTFHGGGIVVDGGVWGVLGDKTAGKSTLLGALALAGVPVMTDDVLIVDRDMALAGPRSVDLRGDAAERLGAGEPLGRVGARERWRLALPPVDAQLPLRGWITLRWGDEIAIEPVLGQARLAGLLPHQGVRVGASDPAAFLRLSALPQYRLTRPRDWDSLAPLRERLLEALAG
jgi:hypothetical protein